MKTFQVSFPIRLEKPLRHLSGECSVQIRYDLSKDEMEGYILPEEGTGFSLQDQATAKAFASFLSQPGKA